MADESTIEPWQDIVARKQKACREKLPQAWILPASVIDELHFPLESNVNRLIELDIPRRSGILTDKELTITEKYNVRPLLDALASSELSAQEVTAAFCKRAAIAQQLTNCLTETYFEEAQARASQLDELKRQGKSAGPLHGLPVSIKDSMQVKGSEATIGFVSFLGHMSDKNAVLVDILLELGAVIYVKTNIPQTMMTADSQNNIYGRTLNPHNTIMTAGGSSGGEGALMALRGSPLGAGTDVAGSIRIPAFCNGTYGFKPTTFRIPYTGQKVASAPGEDFFMACAGPSSNDFDGLEIFMKSVLDARPASYDSSVIDVPWRGLASIDSKAKLRLGLMLEDPMFPLHPPVKRALDEAARKLVAKGHEIIQIPAEKCQLYNCLQIAFAMLELKTGAAEAMQAAGEPPVASVVGMQTSSQAFLKPYPADIEQLTDVPRLAALRGKRAQLVEAWREIWNTYQVDAIICPPGQHTALPHDKFLLPPYTAFLNTLDYPACIIPFMKSSKQLDSVPMDIEANQYGPAYEPELVDGLPCAIQVFTSSMRDEECLQIGRAIDQCLHQSTT